MFWRSTLICIVLSASAAAQSKPQVRVNMVNVCAPGEAEKGEIAAALARIPAAPRFSADFEVSRGHTTDKSGASDWVRLRREFAAGSVFTNAQYLMSVTGGATAEGLVLHLRNDKPGEPLQISFDHEVTAGTPADVLKTDTPPSHIRIERFGKSGLALARCADADQTAYEPLFRAAAERFTAYRDAMRVRATVAAELAQLKAAPAAGKSGH